MNARRTRRLVALLVLATLLATIGCGPDVILEYRTEVHSDGSIYRHVEARGVAGAPAREPRSKDAPELLDAEVAQLDKWRTVHRRAESIELDGTFSSAGELDGAFTLGKNDARVRESDRLTLEQLDLGILQHFHYREVYADPYGPEQVDAALDRMVTFTWDVIREEIRRELGEDIDTSRAQALAFGPGRAVLGRIASGLLHDRQHAGVVEQLQRLGLPVAAGTAEDDKFAEVQLALLSRHARAQVAAALSTPDREITADDLAFWPVDEQDFWKQVEEVFDRSQAGKEAADATVKSMLDALLGFFGGSGGQYRFRFSLRMPGRLFRSNGVLDESGTGWFFRGDEVTSSGNTMDAESVLLDDAALERLSARRPEDAATLAEIVDILTARDPDGELGRLLEQAVERRNLKLLRTPPPDWKGPKDVAAQLADLLS